MLYISADIETTGLNIDNCCIIEFGAVIDDLRIEEGTRLMSTFHTYVLNDLITGEPYPLSMHSKILKRIADREKGFQYTSTNKLGFVFKQFLLKNGFTEEGGVVHINVAGKNFGTFDLKFLEEKTDWKKHIKVRQRIIDPSILYYKIGDELLPGMEECLTRAGFIPKVEHTALEDALQVVQLLRKKRDKLI